MIKPATHILVCGAAHPEGDSGARGCTCDHAAALEILTHLQRRLDERNMHGVQVTACECMDLCQYGPVVIVYPTSTWYCNVSREKVDEILNAVWNNAILKSYAGSGCSVCPTAAKTSENHETAAIDLAH